MRNVNINEETERHLFAMRAAKMLADNPNMTTASDEICPGAYLGIRWGLMDRSLVVVKLSEEHDPVIYSDLIHDMTSRDACDTEKDTETQERINGLMEASKAAEKAAGAAGLLQDSFLGVSNNKNQQTWINWPGGKECPVPFGTLIDVIYRAGPGAPSSAVGARLSVPAGVPLKGADTWEHRGTYSDIVSFRLSGDSNAG